MLIEIGAIADIAGFAQTGHRDPIYYGVGFYCGAGRGTSCLRCSFNWQGEGGYADRSPTTPAARHKCSEEVLLRRCKGGRQLMSAIGAPQRGYGRALTNGKEAEP
ncbi:MAG TPA: hypothetical protein VHA77_03425 [Xanthobacteraceae bacterium]|nr:hypothetical protein [Xanthobacteraceae bacterium]